MVVALEVIKCLVLIGANDIGDILFGVYVADLAIGNMLAKVVTDGMHQMCFA